MTRLARRTRRSRPGPGTPASPSRPASRSTTAGTSAPARPATSSTWSTCSSRSRSTPGSAPATSTSPTPAPTCRASPRPASAACCGWAERCRYPTPTLTREQLAQRQAQENWDQPYPDGSRKRSPRSSNLPDDYAAQTAAAANAASGLGPAAADDPDPLITAPLYGRWHALTQRLLTNRDGTPAPDDTNWVHRLNLDPRFRVPAAFGAAGGRGQRRKLHGRRLAADRRRARGQHRDPAAAPRHRRRPARWYTAHLAPLAAARPERALGCSPPYPAGYSPAARRLAFTAVRQPGPAGADVHRDAPGAAPRRRLMRSLPFTRHRDPRQPAGPDQRRAGQRGAAEDGPARRSHRRPGRRRGRARHAVLGGGPAGPPALAAVPRLLALAAIALAAGLILLAFLPAASVVLLVATAGLVAGYLVLRGWRTASGPRGQPVARTTRRRPRSPPCRRTPASRCPNQARRSARAPGAATARPRLRFKAALRDSYQLLQADRAAGQRPALARLPLATATTASITAVDPARDHTRGGA